MKIDVIPIVADHLDTLRDHRSGRRSLVDVLIFYGAPLACAAIPTFHKIAFDDAFYNLSITFFGIFIALLLNVQVAIFGILQRKWEKPQDEHLIAIQADKLKKRRELLAELNANLSYMTLLSCAALIAFLSFYVFDIGWNIPACATIFFYAHFVATLLMAIKRAHILFQKEYEADR
jgi:hypothetical protein